MTTSFRSYWSVMVTLINSESPPLAVAVAGLNVTVIGLPLGVFGFEHAPSAVAKETSNINNLTLLIKSRMRLFLNDNGNGYGTRTC